MSSALVTGAAGFVGRHLVRALETQGWDVVALDPKPLDADGHKVVQASLLSLPDVRRAVDGVDVVLHEGAASSSMMFEPDPFTGVEVNVMGGLNLLRASREAGVKRLVYASTSSLYGSLPVPWREDVAVDCAPNAYAASKLAFEYLAKVYTSRRELDTVGLRYFSVYGPGEETKGSYANMISQFLWSMRKGEPPIVYGDGNQTRDFTHVDDIVRANLRALETEAVGEVFNVGTGRETTINHLVETLSALLESPLRAQHVPNPIPNYVYRTLADTKKAERLLGFTAEVSFEEGVARLVRGGTARSGGGE